MLNITLSLNVYWGLKTQGLRIRCSYQMSFQNCISVSVSFIFHPFWEPFKISKCPHWRQRPANVNPWPRNIKVAQSCKRLMLPSHTNAFHSFCQEFAGGTLTMTTDFYIIGYTQYWERNVNLVRPAGCKASRRRLDYHDRSKIRNLLGFTRIDKRKWLYITQPKILRSAHKWPFLIVGKIFSSTIVPSWFDIGVICQ